MIKMWLDIWIDDNCSRMKLPSDERLSEGMQMFARKKKDKAKLEELSNRLVETVNEINEVFCKMDME